MEAQLRSALANRWPGGRYARKTVTNSALLGGSALNMKLSLGFSSVLS
jgi:hypothetical protein